MIWLELISGIISGTAVYYLSGALRDIWAEHKNSLQISDALKRLEKVYGLDQRP